MTISIETAEAMIRAATATATATERKLAPVNIAVVDASAHLVAFGGMDGALLGAIGLSEEGQDCSPIQD